MTSDYIELTFQSIQCFADDGKLDVDELEKLLEIALRDGVVDSDEKRVLGNIISRLNEGELTQAMKEKILEIQEQYF